MQQMIMIVAFIALMYFLMIRPQQKQQQKQRNMLSNLKPGQQVVTIGGLHATVSSISADRKTVALDADGILLTFEIAAIRTVKDDVKADAPAEIENVGTKEETDSTDKADSDVSSEK